MGEIPAVRWSASGLANYTLLDFRRSPAARKEDEKLRARAVRISRPGVQHLAGFQAGQSRRVDAHALGDLGQRQSLAFAHGFEPRHQAQDRRETPPIDGAGQPLADRVRRVLAANRFFLGPLLGGALWLHRWLGAKKARNRLPYLCQPVPVLSSP